MRAPKAPMLVALIAASTVVTLAPSRAHAVVVVEGPSFSPTPAGFLGAWNGVSGVAIAQNWIISARHVGGAPGTTFSLDGHDYTADLVIGHPTQDVLIARLTEPLPGWHRLAPLAAAGQAVALGGMGYTAGEPLENGYAWAPSALTWGRNTLDGVGARMMITFDDPASDAAVESEAIFTLLDSGGGLFTFGPDGALELAGIATSVSGPFGQSRYGATSFAVNLEPLHAWILSHVSPGEPITSSIAPPRGVDTHIPVSPPVPAPATTLLLALPTLTSLAKRRRRHTTTPRA